jgi:hypothetical protein
MPAGGRLDSVRRMSIEPNPVDSDPVEPDGKDWTWVLRAPCAECGYEAASLEPVALPRRVRANAQEWVAVLAAGESSRARPAPGVWSPLEYGCHVRDVLRVFDRRLTLMLTQDDPLFDNWDQDATALAERYGEQDPAVVSADLVAAAEVIADRFGGVRGEQWSRPGRRSDGSAFSVDSLGRYFLHDIVHHAYDVGAAGRR